MLKVLEGPSVFSDETRASTNQQCRIRLCLFSSGASKGGMKVGGVIPK